MFFNILEVTHYSLFCLTKKGLVAQFLWRGLYLLLKCATAAKRVFFFPSNFLLQVYKCKMLSVSVCFGNFFGNYLSFFFCNAFFNFEKKWHRQQGNLLVVIVSQMYLWKYVLSYYMRNLRSECTPCKLYPISPSIKLGFKNKLRKVSCLRWGVRPNLASIALSYSFESYCPGLCRRRHYKQSHIEQQSILIRLTIRYLKQNSTSHFKLGTDILFALYMCVRMLYALYMCV